MAVVFNGNNANQDQDDEEQTNGPQVTNPGVIGSVGASSTPAPSNPQAGKPSSSGQFTNIKSYIDANKNFNQAGGGLAGKVADNLTNKGNEVKQQVQGAIGNFQDKVTAQVDQLNQGAQAAQQAVVNPMAAVADQQNVDSIARARDGVYQGPTSLTDLEGKQNQGVLQANAENFDQTVKQGQTENGRFNLLRNMFGKPTYNSGQQNLDNLLIQGNKEQVQRIQNTGKIAADVNRNLNQGIAQTNQQGLEAQQQAEAIKNQTREALNNRVAQENQAIQGQFSQAQLDQNKALYNLAKGLQSGNLSSEDAARLGVQNGQRIYNTDLSSIIQRGADPTLQGIASQDNYAQLAALQKLIGGAANEDSSKVLSQFSDPTQAQQFDPNAYGLDANGFQTNTAGTQAAYKNAVQQALDSRLKTIQGYNKDYNLDYAPDLAFNKSVMNNFEEPIEAQFANMFRQQDPRAYANMTDAQIIEQQTAGKKNANKTLLDTLNQARKQYGVDNKVSVGGNASIDDYDQIDERTGMSKGEQLLRSLGLLK